LPESAYTDLKTLLKNYLHKFGMIFVVICTVFISGDQKSHEGCIVSGEIAVELEQFSTF